MRATAAAVAAAVPAPAARADVVDVMIDQIVDPVLSAAGGSVGVVDGGAVAAGVGGVADAGVAADATSGLDSLLVGIVDELNAAVNGVAQAWVTGPVGQALDPIINAPWVYVFGVDLIGNGINGFTGTNDSLLGSLGILPSKFTLGAGGLTVGLAGPAAPTSTESPVSQAAPARLPPTLSAVPAAQYRH